MFEVGRPARPARVSRHARDVRLAARVSRRAPLVQPYAHIPPLQPDDAHAVVGDTAHRGAAVVDAADADSHQRAARAFDDDAAV